MSMMFRKSYGRRRKGMVPVALVIVVLVAVVAVAGVGYYFYHASVVGGLVPPQATTQPTAAAADSIDSLQVGAPTFTAPSTSALPELQATALNLSAANLPSTGIVKNFSANTDTSYSYNLDIPIPEVKLTIPTQTAPPADGTGTGTDGTSGSDQSQPNATNCAQFSSIPNAQYCSAVGDANGIALCQACKAAGF